jgi:dTDP-glucose 4,6-dehydratase
MREVHRVVVTGGAGFLGSHLCTRLVAEGVEVVCRDDLLTGGAANIGHLQGAEGLRFLRCDLTDFVHVSGPVDAVLHFASLASPVDYLELPIETLKVGSLGPLHTLGPAMEKGARFVLASTSEVYGDPQVHPRSRRGTGVT